MRWVFLLCALLLVPIASRAAAPLAALGVGGPGTTTSPPAIDCGGGPPCPGVNGIATSGGKYTITLTTTKTNDEICVGALVNSTDTITAISDGASLTWASRKDLLNGNDGISFWCAKSSGILSSDVITVTVGTVNADSAFVTSTAFGISGVTFSSPFDPNASVPASCGNTCNSTIPAITTSNPDDLICETARFASTGTPTATSTWTAVFAPSSGFFLEQCKSFTSTQSSLTPSIPSDVNGAILDALTAN